MRAKLAFLAGPLLAAAAVVAAGLAWAQTRSTQGAPGATTPIQLLTTPIPANAPNAAQLERGRYLVVMGDCASCHTRQGGEPMAGGLGMNTPFGTIYTPNITPDPNVGIGGWTPDQFWNAMHRGRDDEGHYLYPAFPYVFFTNVTRQDSDAMLAYLKTVPAIHYTPPATHLPFPFNIRLMMWGWNLLFFREHTFQADPSKSAQWNRGAYIVNGLGHCGQCHTPTNFLGANKTSQAFQGGELENWVAPDLTPNRRQGLGAWSDADIVAYLKTGRNARAQASGPMAEVVSYSTSLMTESDLQAVATFLRSQAASSSPEVNAPAADRMQRGAAIYSDACASCHLEQGKGQPGYFPPLGNDQVLQQKNPDAVLHMILAGTRTAPTVSRPTPLAMPSFAWKLDNDEIADVTTYIRNSWGNEAAAVDAGRVGSLRRKLDLKTSRLTDNAGDHPSAPNTEGGQP